MVDYQDFIKSAEQLLQTGDEMGYRNAVSRAYYALYHRCLPLFNEMSDRPADDHHAQVVRTLRQQPQYESIANQLNKLRKRRNTADYELHKTFEKSDFSQKIGFLAGNEWVVPKFEKSDFSQKSDFLPRMNGWYGNFRFLALVCCQFCFVGCVPRISDAQSAWGTLPDNRKLTKH